MRIKARMGVSVDGFVATAEGAPSLVLSPDFVPGVSHGYPQFIQGCEAVVMGRTTFLPALGSPTWPWGEMEVFVLTSRPLPPEAPAHVVVSRGGPNGLVDQLRGRRSGGDVHLVGGPRTIAAIHSVGALHSLELVVLPFVLGDGVRLWPSSESRPRLQLTAAPLQLPDGSVVLAYSTS